MQSGPTNSQVKSEQLSPEAHSKPKVMDNGKHLEHVNGIRVKLSPAEWIVALAAGPGDKYSRSGRVLAITAFYLTVTVCYTQLCSLNGLLYIVISLGLFPQPRHWQLLLSVCTVEMFVEFWICEQVNDSCISLKRLNNQKQK